MHTEVSFMMLDKAAGKHMAVNGVYKLSIPLPVARRTRFLNQHWCNKLRVATYWHTGCSRASRKARKGSSHCARRTASGTGAKQASNGCGGFFL